MLQSIGYNYVSGVPKRIKDPGINNFLNDIELALQSIKVNDAYNNYSHESSPSGRTRKHTKSRHRLSATNNNLMINDNTNNVYDDQDSEALFALNNTAHSLGLHEELDHENDLEDNLSFSSIGEDSLSVIVGAVSMPNNKSVKVWIVSDTGSMVQLINKKYAGEQGFKAVALPPSQRFSISSPGGGADDITHVITLEVRVMMRRYLKVVENYEEQFFETELSDPEEKTVRMSFGVCL